MSTAEKKKKNTTFSITEKTRTRLKSLSEYSGLSMSAVIDLLVESAELSRVNVRWHVTGEMPIVKSACRNT